MLTDKASTTTTNCGGMRAEWKGKAGCLRAWHAWEGIFRWVCFSLDGNAEPKTTAITVVKVNLYYVRTIGTGIKTVAPVPRGIGETPWSPSFGCFTVVTFTKTDVFGKMFPVYAGRSRLCRICEALVGRFHLADCVIVVGTWWCECLIHTPLRTD